MTKRPDIDLDDLRRRLIARREELLRLAEAAKEGGKPVELDQTAVGRLSRMDALQVQAMALETERRRTAELARIDAACIGSMSGISAIACAATRRSQPGAWNSTRRRPSVWPAPKGGRSDRAGLEENQGHQWNDVHSTRVVCFDTKDNELT